MSENKLSRSYEADLAPQDVARLVAAGLEEDLGLAGDITTCAAFSATDQAQGEIRSRQAGVVAGLPLAEAAFRALDGAVEITRHAVDGDKIAAGDILMHISGAARTILTGERVALNFLGHLSGIASKTARFVEKIQDTPAQICCTRKTLPGLRLVQKYAVRAGGGVNHRFGLFDAVLIKDNHIAAKGSLEAMVQAAKSRAGHLVKIEVEVDTLAQLDAVLKLKIDAVLLDNMAPDILEEAVRRGRAAQPRVVLEASGGVTLDTVRDIAKTGVDLISVGGLTHSAANLDLGLDFTASSR